MANGYSSSAIGSSARGTAIRSAGSQNMITNFNLNLNDLSASTENRSFYISGDSGAKFNLEIKNEDGKYYNFVTQNFQTGVAGLHNEVIENGLYKGAIKFPAVTDDDQYDISLLALENTIHRDYVEYRFEDNSIDINTSLGSNSLLLTKVIYQYTDVTVTISCDSPTSTIETSQLVQSSLTVPRLGKKVKTSFTTSVTAPANKAYSITTQPTVSNVFSEISTTVGTAPINLPHEDTSSSTNFQWPISNVKNISPGMLVYGDNVTSGTKVSHYTITVKKLIGTKNERAIILHSSKAINSKETPVIVNGLITTQAGNIIFDKQQASALRNDTIKIASYGVKNINKSTGHRVEITNLKIALTPITTTTTSAVVNSKTVPVASIDGIIPGTSTVSGIGINANLANPTVSSRAVSSTGGDLVLSSEQNLESGVTLNVANTGKVATITGDIEIFSAGADNVEIKINIEDLLSIA